MGLSFLRCDSCHRTIGPFTSYEEWEDYAKLDGWYIGDEMIVLCPDCAPAE